MHTFTPLSLCQRRLKWFLITSPSISFYHSNSIIWPKCAVSWAILTNFLFISSQIPIHCAPKYKSVLGDNLLANFSCQVIRKRLAARASVYIFSDQMQLQSGEWNFELNRVWLLNIILYYANVTIIAVFIFHFAFLLKLTNSHKTTVSNLNNNDYFYLR